MTKDKLRIRELETALAPFALRGMMFASVGMDLKAKRKDPRAVGGTWCLDNKGEADLSYDSHHFIDATIAYGTEATRLLMAANIESKAEQNAAQKESEASTIH